MNMKLVEPLRELFKDEVRVLGREWACPVFVGRHPFPDPASPSVSPRGDARALRHPAQADAIYLEEIRKAGLYDAIWQAFAVLLPVRWWRDGRRPHLRLGAGAARGDLGRRHDRPGLRLPGDFLPRVTTRIINEVKGINRVVYDYTSKPPGTIEWEYQDA